MIKRFPGVLMAALAAMAAPSHAQNSGLPQDIARQLPAGHAVMTSKSSDFNGDGKVDYVVVVASKREAALHARGDTVPRRPLLVFMQGEGRKFSLAARNDEVVMAADEGGQCDPFMDGEEGLAVKGAFFTVQNAVACGEHWTDFTTFRYASEHGHFVFHKRIFESMVFNTSNAGGAEALVAGKRVVTHANKSRPVRLSWYRPPP